MASAAACSSFGDTSEPLPDEAGDAATVPEGAAPAESGADADAAVDGSVAFPCKAGQTAFCQDFDTAPRPWAFTFVGEQGDAGGSDASVASVTTTTADLPPSAPNALHAHLAPGGDQAVLTLALPAQGNVMRVQFDV
ncbi:MAG: hypothetical protein JWP87_3665, partial [Labilithrix sp.]|nr:hypothetical protein [Labilithrix sp.]